MRRTLDLFPRPARATPRIIAKAIDHGSFPDGRTCYKFNCKKCGFEDWLAASRTQGNKGIPCPTCNNQLKEQP